MERGIVAVTPGKGRVKVFHYVETVLRHVIHEVQERMELMLEHMGTVVYHDVEFSARYPRKFLELQ